MSSLTYFQLQDRLAELRASGSDDTNVFVVRQAGVQISFETEDMNEIKELKKMLANAEQDTEAQEDETRSVQRECDAKDRLLTRIQTFLIGQPETPDVKALLTEIERQL